MQGSRGCNVAAAATIIRVSWLLLQHLQSAADATVAQVASKAALLNKKTQQQLLLLLLLLLKLQNYSRKSFSGTYSASTSASMAQCRRSSS